MSPAKPALLYRWRSRKEHADRFGQPCRIVPRSGVIKRADGSIASWGYGGSVNPTIVEFADGTRVTTTRGSIRRRTR